MNMMLVFFLQQGVSDNGAFRDHTTGEARSVEHRKIDSTSSDSDSTVPPKRRRLRKKQRFDFFNQSL